MTPVEKEEINGELIFDIKSVFSSSIPDVVYRPLTSSGDELYGFTLDGVLSKKECENIIRMSENVSDTKSSDCEYTFWNKTCKTSEEIAAARAYRDVETMEFRHPPFAKELWNRMSKFIPREYASINLCVEDEDPRWQCDLEGKWEAYGTNQHILLAKYDAGGHFAPHTDGYHVLDFNKRSMMSIVLYLNDCEAGGGDTRFYRDELRSKLKRNEAGRWTCVSPELEITTISPRAGRALVFFHNHMHEGVPPQKGNRKYIIRSDIMYHRVPPICTSPRDVEAYKLYMKANSAVSVQESQRLFQRCFRLSPALAEIFGM